MAPHEILQAIACYDWQRRWGIDMLSIVNWAPTGKVLYLGSFSQLSSQLRQQKRKISLYKNIIWLAVVNKAMCVIGLCRRPKSMVKMWLGALRASSYLGVLGEHPKLNVTFCRMAHMGAKKRCTCFKVFLMGWCVCVWITFWLLNLDLCRPRKYVQKRTC